jgi:hypothetical protein
MLIVSSDTAALLELFDEHVPPVVEKWIDREST